MKLDQRAAIPCACGILAAMLLTSDAVYAQAQPPRAPAPSSSTRLGVDVFGGAGIGWPAPQDSFEALGLNSTSFEVGGGVRLSGIWRKLFVQATVSRWNDTGERAFVDSDGNSFPLGIPLELRATFLDGTIGVKDVVRNASGRVSYILFVGAGAGVVRYEESSPFAEPGENIDTQEPSYHALAGVEIPIWGPLAVAIDARYRFIPGILGDDGASAAFDDDFLGGFHSTVALRLGFGGPPYVVPPPPKPPPPAPRPIFAQPGTSSPGQGADGVTTQAAPVFLLPDATRTPLRTLPTGTAVKILEEKGDWVRVEFSDPQFGRRVGYVQRKFVQAK